MATTRRFHLDRKCKDVRQVIGSSTDKEESNTSFSGKHTSLTKEGTLPLSENTPRASTAKEKVQTKFIRQVKEKSPSLHLINTEDENDPASRTKIRAKKRKTTANIEKDVMPSPSTYEDLHQVSDDESGYCASKRPKLPLLRKGNSANDDNTALEFSDTPPVSGALGDLIEPSASEYILIPTDEQRLRSELPISVIEYANKLEVYELKDFTRQVRETIWTHFYDENSTYEQVSSNRPIPGFEVRSQQIKQARGVLSQVFNQIVTPTHLSLFIRDYVSVLKFGSFQRFSNSLQMLISEHQKRERSSFIDKFCAIQ